MVKWLRQGVRGPSSDPEYTYLRWQFQDLNTRIQNSVCYGILFNMIRSLAESFALKGIQSIHNFSLKTAELNEKYMNDQRIGKKRPLSKSWLMYAGGLAK